MAEQRTPSILWLFSGALVLEVSVACAGTVSGITSAAATELGFRGRTLTATAVGVLCVVFAVSFLAVLLGFARVARAGATCIPLRWVVCALLSVPIAAPFWGLCTVFVVERLTQSESVRIATDSVIYKLVLTLVIPVTVGVPILLAFLYRRSRIASGSE
jgi:hypothetical protein